MDDLTILDHPAGASLQVRVKPRSSRSAIVQLADGALVVALAAPPVDGEANAELLRFLAATVRVPKSSIRLASGEKARLKILHFSGLSADDLRARLAPALPTKK